MRSTAPGARSTVARAALAASLSLTLLGTSAIGAPALAQQSQSSSGGGNGEQGSGSGGSQEDDGSFWESILPGFLQNWLGIGENESGGSEQAQGGGGQGGAGGQGGQGGQGGGDDQPPAVVVTKASLQSIGERYEFIGRIEAIQRVAIQARVAGFIQEVDFQGGDTIEAGQTLFQIEPAQYQAALLSAQAQFTSAQSQESQAQRSLQRFQELSQSSTVSQAQLDQANAAYQNARGQRLQAEALVRQAQLNLNYTTITAPIDGVISEPLITKGNYVTASSGALANLVQLDPIWGTFPISESRLATWHRVGMGGRGDDASVDRQYRLSLVLPNQQTYDAQGDFSFVSNQVDPSTGTVEVRVQFPNPDGLLLPNQNVTLVASERNPPLQPVIPQAAVQLDREGRSVFVVDANNVVHRVPVQVGKDMRGNVAIASGLQEGALVVTQGIQQIEDGTRVKPSMDNQQTASGEPGAGGDDSDGGAASDGSSAEGQGGGADAGAEGSTPNGEGKGGDEASGRSNAGQQRIGTQSQSETQSAIEKGKEREEGESSAQPEGGGNERQSGGNGGDGA